MSKTLFFDNFMSGSALNNNLKYLDLFLKSNPNISSIVFQMSEISLNSCLASAFIQTERRRGTGVKIGLNLHKSIGSLVVIVLKYHFFNLNF